MIRICFCGVTVEISQTAYDHARARYDPMQCEDEALVAGAYPIK
jgi:hypothetical protein